MLRKIFSFIIVAILSINYTSITYASHHGKRSLEENTGDPATEDRRRDEKKKYVEEVQSNETKRYVGDAQNDDVENPKRRGLEKRYIEDEEDPEVFFQKEEKALHTPNHLEDPIYD